MLTPRQYRQLWYLPVLASAMALMMARIMAAARLLDVPSFATYSTGLLLSTTFCMLACLGLQSLLQRDMPVLLARGRHRGALVLLVQALLVAFACALAALLPAALASGTLQVSPALALAGVVHGLSQQAFVIATVESRSSGDAVRYGWQNLARAVLVMGTGIVAAWSTGSAMLMLLSEAVMSLLLVAGILLRIERRSGWPLTRLAALGHRSWRRVAWPTAGVMLAVSFATFALLNVDRWIAASWLSPVAFAQFAFAAIVLLVAQSAQSMVNASVYPMLSRRFGLRGPAAAYRLASGISLASLAAGALLAWPAQLIAEAVIRRWFGAYEPAIDLLWPLLAAGVLRVSDYWSGFLLICNHERHLLKVQVLACGAAGGAWLFLQSARGSFAPTALDICWLTLLLSATSHIASAASAFLLRSSLPARGKLSHAQPQ